MDRLAAQLRTAMELEVYPHIVAIACDTPLPHAKVPVIDLNDIERIADMLLQHAVLLTAAATALRSA